MKTTIATLALGSMLMTSHVNADIKKPTPTTVEGKVTSALRAPKPEYPEIARIFRLEGKVVVNVVVDHRCVPTDASIVKSTSDVFNTSVLNTVKAWRFESATEESGSRVMQIPFTFKMK